MSIATSAATPPRALFVALALASVYLVWGSTYLAIRVAVAGYPPFLMAGGRFLIAGLILYPWMHFRGHPAPTRAQWANVAVLALCLLLLGNGMVCVAEEQVSSGLAAVTVASTPLWTGLFAALRGRSPGRREWFGLCVGFLGVLWLVSAGTLSATPRGMVALLIAPAAWAFGSIWSKGRDLPSPFMSSAGQMVLGGVMMLVLGWVLGERISTPVPSSATWATLYLIGFGSLVGFSAYIWLLHNVRPALATSYAYVNPILAVILGALILGEHFPPRDFAAMALILAGVVLIGVGKKR